MEPVIRIMQTCETPPEAMMRLLQPPAEDLARAEEAVRGIVARVKAEGDAAVLALTRQFDWPEATLDALRVTPEEMANAAGTLDPAVLTAMEHAIANIRAYQERTLPESWFDEMGPGALPGPALRGGGQRGVLRAHAQGVDPPPRC